ncbi:DUF1127 domain-containing protein [Roseomonas sp. NAR14]|uniref:DUF1127 domain-containing protein n=1 Tax=Roseomonas acroporae TaxID=2937791 RepID=A0A9X1YAD7_9PROT|nr:DUF1127 domain-containing protein [Roseomonas acroporae]MCK8782791.1 DUF1127 domain-containing protein [Roseomonas acroporae]
MPVHVATRATALEAHAFRPAVPSVWRGALDWFRRARTAIVTRRELAAMDERMLADIGLSRSDAAREANRPFWEIEAPPRG